MTAMDLRTTWQDKENWSTEIYIKSDERATWDYIKHFYSAF